VRLATRIFLSFLLISTVCFAYPIHYFIGDLRTFFLKSVEDPLADQANILAELAGVSLASGSLDRQQFERLFHATYARSLSARIYGFPKTGVDVRVYITDARGIVLYDSVNPQNVGADFSQWRDVALTLRGHYGARSTRHDPLDARSTILHVAAPILVKGTVAGVLTVAKPTTTINAFIQQERPKILWRWYGAALLAIVLSFIASVWLTWPIKRLTRYAHDVRQGKRVVLPAVGRSELRDMALALEEMRESLEGKNYVERYIHTLTHEIKSPLTAIRGAAELLDEAMPRAKRQHFLANIRTEAGRIQDLVDRLLELAGLEARKSLHYRESVNLENLVNGVLESMAANFSAKGVRVTCHGTDGIMVTGDPFLLHRAVANLLQNAVDFSPRGGEICVTVTGGDMVSLVVVDQGPGIPEHYRERVFDRFFSLQRPDGVKKSTGLGLNFVREVATLHNGSIVLENTPEGGACAVLKLPV
jgi:two-component system, OmpR family, sensor histidine kinase CreC